MGLPYRESALPSYGIRISFEQDVGRRVDGKIREVGRFDSVNLFKPEAGLAFNVIFDPGAGKLVRCWMLRVKSPSMSFCHHGRLPHLLPSLEQSILPLMSEMRQTFS